MTTTVLLIRHGQTESNITGYYMGQSEEDLNESGYAQVRHLSHRLASLHIASVYTSPLKRARTTATLLAQPHNLEPRVVDDLTEIHIGDWQGLHMDEIQERWPDIWHQSRMDPSEITMPNGESFHQVTERALRSFQTVLAAEPDKQAVMVTHDAVIRVIVAHILGVSNSIYRNFVISNASLTQINVTAGKARLTTLNDTAHLQT